MQILDFSQIFNAAVFVDADANACSKHPSEQSKNMLKHFILNLVRAQFWHHKQRYGQMVIACDHSSWRYDFFKEYKHRRKESKKNDTSGIDWNFVKEVIDELYTELDTYFPFPLIRVHKAEGDDVIGTMCKFMYYSAPVDAFGNRDPERILIISSDKDNLQLHKYKNVQQYSLSDKKLITPPISWRHSLMEKIVKGESSSRSDGIPNIKSPNDTFVTGFVPGTRQPSITKDYLNKFIASSNPIDVCLTEEERKNFIRNETLVSYDKIPRNIQAAIVMKYNEQVKKSHSKMALMTYFTDRRMSNLLTSIHDFYL